MVISPCDAQDSGETEDYLIAVSRSISVSNNLPSICPISPTGSLTIIPNYTPNTGNVYAVELSDNTGIFGTSPLVVGSGSISPISITIPSSVSAGSLYKFRVKGSNPVVLGNESNNFGYGVTTATLTVSGKNAIAFGDSTTLKINFTGAKPYSFTLSNGKSVSNITADFYEFYVKPTASTTYLITSATGGCGSATISGTGYVGVSAYCIPTYSTVCSPSATTAKMAISRVEFKNSANVTLLDNNNSNCSPDNFSDFTNLTAPAVSGGNNYSITATAYYGSNGYFPMFYSAWIDYNHNNNFNDSGELVWQSTVADLIATGTFTIPASASGGSTRMRIRSSYTSSPIDPCVIYSYGESEDYLLDVQLLNSVGGSVSGSTNICPSKNNTILTLSGQVGNVVKWQSADNANFTSATDILNTTTTLSISNVQTTKYYRAVVKLGNLPTANSNYAVLTVTPNTPLTIPSNLVTINFGASVNLLANGCVGTLSWHKLSGNLISMPTSPTCSEQYIARCNETNGLETCSTGYSPNITVKVTPSGSEITSMKSGNWEMPATWDIGRSPQNGDLVIIRPNDLIMINTANAQAQCLQMSSFNSLQFMSGSGKLSLGF